MSTYQEELWNERDERDGRPVVSLFTAMRIVAALEKKLQKAHDAQVKEALSYKGPTMPEDQQHEIMQAVSRAPRQVRG